MVPCKAQSDLEPLRESLIAMRGNSAGPGVPRGSTPQMTAAKHHLRNWVESKLNAVKLPGDEGELERKLNAELRAAKLICGATTAGLEPCPDRTLLGFSGGCSSFRFAFSGYERASRVRK